jgi:hypothetical protein
MKVVIEEWSLSKGLQICTIKGAELSHALTSKYCFSQSNGTVLQNSITNRGERCNYEDLYIILTLRLDIKINFTMKDHQQFPQ